MQGRKDSPLTETGVEQVRDLRETLNEFDLKAAYSSTAGRALRTAEILLEDRELSITKESDLKEIDLGDWEGKKFDHLKEAYPKNFQMFWEDPEKYIPPGGETVEEVQERGLRVLEDIHRKYPDENVLVVSHSCILKAILLHHSERPIKDLWKPPELKPASLTVLDSTTSEISYHH